MTTNTMTQNQENPYENLAILDNIIIMLILGVSIYTTIIGVFQDQPFWDWAWARHQNPLSWVVRPFTIPLYAYFAYRRNLLGLLTTIIGIAASMYWFPIPIVPNTDIAHFLAQEQTYLTTDWTFIKILWSSLVPITMISLAIAFWKQSVPAGLIVVNIIAFLKITWSVTEDPQSGWILVPFALVGLLITDLLIIFVARKRGIEIFPSKS